MTYIIGIGGGTGSGKTTVAQEINDLFPNEEVLCIEFDNYYRDLSHLGEEERANVNFDHPDSLEETLLESHLKALKKGESIEMPGYDFITHTRRDETTTIRPTPVIMVEGILTLAYQSLLPLFDLKIYVDTEPDIRFIRRLTRDIEERGRDLKGVIDQYQKTVRPMHIEFVEPSKRLADIIIPEGRNDAAMDILQAAVKSQVKKI